jgi:carbon-monoxide dehydrogenase large subunit
LGDIAAQLAGQPGFAIPGGLAPGLEATSHFEPDGLTYSNGTHGVEVEVDVTTGAVKLLRYVVVHDCGRMINPTIVEGQIRGGVAHGIGNALLEEMKYDANGQPLTVNYGDYLLPEALDIPDIEIIHMESPTPLNPLGVKGTGESGTIPATAAIASAIENALEPFGVRITETPVTPMRIIELIKGTDAS